MNKKIKVIELWNIIAQVEDIEKLPKKIKYDGYIFELQTLSRDYYCIENYDFFTKRVDDKPFNSFLNDYVEILEDNTEEIEELDNWFVDERKECREFDIQAINLCFSKHRDKINELVKAVNSIRKDKNND